MKKSGRSMLGKSLLVALALVCVVGQPALAAPTMNAAAEALVYQGHQLAQQGKYPEAMNKFAEAVKADPASSLPYSMAAQLLVSLQRVAKPDSVARMRTQAEGYARQALKISADDPLAQEALRQLEDNLPPPLHQQSAEAEAAMQEGERAFAARQFDQALVHYERSTQLDPKSSLPWIYAGDCFFARERWAEAEIRFRKGVEVEPLNAQGWRFLADALVAQGKRGEAEVALLNAIAAQPSQRPNWLKLAKMREAAGFPLASVGLVQKARAAIDAATGKSSVTLDPAFSGEAGKKSPDGAVWLAFGLAEANILVKNRTDKVAAQPFAILLAAWQGALAVAEELAAANTPELTDPGLKNLVMLNKAGQLETALLLLQYKEDYRAELEAWKRDHPNGIRKFIDTYGFQP